MPVTEQWINSVVLRWARERLGMTPKEVVEESKKLAKRHFVAVSDQDLIAWEAGTTEPELAQLETLAEIYACPVGYFFLESPPDEPLPVSFRGIANHREQLRSLSQRTLRRFMELAQWMVETLRTAGQPQDGNPASLLRCGMRYCLRSFAGDSGDVEEVKSHDKERDNRELPLNRTCRA